jgi:hypothetical protein
MNQGECDNEVCLENRREDELLECDGSNDDETHCEVCGMLTRKQCADCGEYRELRRCEQCEDQKTICTEFN